MNFKAVAVSVVFLQFVSSPAHSNQCWKDIGRQSMFGSYEQVQQLQKQINATNCAVLGFKFETTRRKTFLVFDSTAKQLTRAKIDGVSKRYEQWRNVSKERLSSLDAGYGFQNLSGMKTGNGSPSLTEAASSLVSGRNTKESKKSQLHSSMSSSGIKIIQNKLNAMGYNAGTEDGISGAKTRAAIKDFQNDLGLNLSADNEPNSKILDYFLSN